MSDFSGLGAISFNGIGPPVRVDKIVEGEDTLNGERYLTMLKRYLLRNYSFQRLIFQQDNAPSHRYHKVLAWLEGKEINRIIWPPKSPDTGEEICFDAFVFFISSREFYIVFHLKFILIERSLPLHCKSSLTNKDQNKKFGFE